MTTRRTLLSSMLAFLAVTTCAQASLKQPHQADREQLIGAWHLLKIEAPGPDGNVAAGPQPTGMLIYTKDGHMSVQLMYPATALSNEYVEHGYEASFGSFDLDESHHLITHHVQGSVTRNRLVGKDLPRSYHLTRDGHLLIRSANPDEHWSVTWAKY